MTALAHAPARHAGAERTDALVGTGRLLRFMLRRDRMRLPAWVLGLPAVMAYFAVAVDQVYADPATLATTAPLLLSPVGALFGGPGYGLEDPTVPRLIAGLCGVYVMLGAALMSLLTVVRHTRAEEQAGRAELVRSGPVGRHAPLAAALVMATAMNVLVAVLVGGVLLGQGYPSGGSWLLAAGVGALGIAFTGVAAVTTQLVSYARGAAGAAGVVLGASFALRALGDMSSTHGNALSWVSPIGWVQQTAPYTLDRWWPLLLPVALGAVAALIGARLSVHRDVDAGLVPPRPGPTRAPAWLRSELALARRLHRPSLIGWSVGLAVAGAAYGAFTGPAVDEFADAPADLLALMGGQQDLLHGFLGVLALTIGLTLAVYAVLSVQLARGEERAGRAEPVLALATTRVRWLGGHVLVVAVGVLWLAVVSGLALGVGVAASTGQADLLGTSLIGVLVQVPAVWVVLGLAALLTGFVPGALPAVWAVVVWSLVAGLFAPILDLPDGVLGISPFEHAGRYPQEAVSAPGVMVLVSVAAVLVVAGLAAFRRRDVLGTG